VFQEFLKQMKLPQIDDTPNVGTEPVRRPSVRLVLSDQDRVGYGQQPDQCTVLEKFQDLALVRQTSAKRRVCFKNTATPISSGKSSERIKWGTEVAELEYSTFTTAKN
jgi:hypothetical protein